MAANREPRFSETLVMPEGLYLATDPNDPLWQEAEGIEREVFLGKGYVNSSDEYNREYQPYRDATDFIGATHDNRVVGSVRAINPNPYGFKTINDALAGRLLIDDQGWELLQGCDLETEVIECNIAVQLEHRSRPFDPDGVANKLVAASAAHLNNFAAQTQNPVERVFYLVSFDQAYYNLFSHQYPPAVRALGPATDYLNSPTVPTLVNCVEMVKHDQERKNALLVKTLGRIAQHNEP